MKLRHLLFILVLVSISTIFILNINMDVYKCTPPAEEEAEFEPALCSFELPEVKTIKILERVEDTKNPDYNRQDCTSFLAVEATDILKFFQNANRVSAGDMHAKLAETSPCYISGVLYFKNGDIAEWNLRSHIQLGHLTTNISTESLDEDLTLNLYCPKSCGFIPTYESQNNR